MELSDILEVTDDLTQPRWVECPEAPGFAIRLRLPDIPGLRGLALQAFSEARANAPAAPGLDMPEVNPGAVGLKLSDYAVQDWRGLTGAGLRYFAEGARNLAVKAATEVEIPFNRQVLEALLKWSPRFYEFVDRSWRKMETQGILSREDDEKNSGNAPATTPTPRPDSVAGASKKKKPSK